MDGDVPLYSIADSNLDLEFMWWILKLTGFSLPLARAGEGGALNPHKPVFGGGRGNLYDVGKGSPKPPRGPHYRGW